MTSYLLQFVVLLRFKLTVCEIRSTVHKASLLSHERVPPQEIIIHTLQINL